MTTPAMAVRDASAPEITEAALVDVQEAARRLGMSVSWVYKAVARGELRCVRIGDSVRFAPSEIAGYIAHRSRPEASEAVVQRRREAARRGWAARRGGKPKRGSKKPA